MPVVKLEKDEAGWWVARLRLDADVEIEGHGKSLHRALMRLAAEVEIGTSHEKVEGDAA